MMVLTTAYRRRRMALAAVRRPSAAVFSSIALRAMARWLALPIFLSAAPAWAQLTVTPTYQILESRPGKAVKGTVTLTNTQDVPLHVKPDTKNWALPPQYEDKLKVEDWLTVKGDEFTLAPGESRTVPFTARLPKKAKGELAGMVSFLTKSETLGQINFRVSVAVYLAAKGTEKFGGDVAGLSVRVSSDTRTVDTGILIANRGNVHIRPHGFVKIYDEKDVLQANVEIRGAPAYPGKARAYAGSTLRDFVLKPGKYKAVVEIRDTDREVELPPVKKSFVITQDWKTESDELLPPDRTVPEDAEN